MSNHFTGLSLGPPMGDPRLDLCDLYAFQSATVIHVIGRNASATKPAKFVVLLVKNKDARCWYPSSKATTLSRCDLRTNGNNVAHCPPPHSLAFLIGVVAGLRSMTPPAAVRWAARLGWLYSESTPLAGRGRRSCRPGRAGRAAAGDATGLPRLTLVCGLWQCDKQNRESRSRPMVLGPNRGRSGATRGC